MIFSKRLLFCWYASILLLFSGVSPEQKESSQLDVNVAVVPADDTSATPSDSASTSEKDVDETPDEQENPDVNIPVDQDLATFSVKESSSDVEQRREDTSTIETIIVEKTHSQVSTSITEITTNSAPNYPANVPYFPIGDPNYRMNRPVSVPYYPTNDPNRPINDPNYPYNVPTAEEITKAEFTPVFAEYPMEDNRRELRERESHTEKLGVLSETTQTSDNTTETAKDTRDASSMTPSR